MLRLVNIVKHYLSGENKVVALDEINLSFKKREFVSVLGPSGCGKTTLLNIIGGLDKYTSGDLVINGKSTKNFTDTDWDSYRNNSIGFVFQNYNLIPHLNVLENVELALTLSGESEGSRKARALDALNKVGLSDQVRKKPNQLSGGQMQRVAIARALVNDPDIILADEPTGALDSSTSVQIMELLKEISKERLIIMVTHNAEIANKFSTRLIRLLDGKLLSDSYPNEDEETAKSFTMKKSAMSYLTSLKLSFKNLITKRARTLLTSFAGSIGIIGIALVLAISSGFSEQIKRMETATLAAFPITIQDGLTIGNIQPGTNFQEMFSNIPDYPEFPDKQKVFFYDDNYNVNFHNNILSDEYMEYLDEMDKKLYNSISLNRRISMNLLNQTTDGIIVRMDTGYAGWQEIIDNYEFLETQYDVLTGSLPKGKEQVALIVDSYNRLSFETGNALGIDAKALKEMKFADFLKMEFKLIPNDVFYYYNEEDNRYNEINFDLAYNHEDAITIEITGILRIKKNAAEGMMGHGLAYTTALTDYVLENSAVSEVALAQSESPDRDVISGASLDSEEFNNRLKRLGVITTPNLINIYPASIEAKEDIKAYLDKYNRDKKQTDKILYMDISEMITSTMGNIINGITAVLVAFAAISLIVSSIMIGIITYISVLERTKEIGVLRSLGARKKDISRVFNAETLIIGFSAGLMGVLIAMLLTIPINAIITNLVTQFDKIASLNPLHAIALILISMALTLVAGLIPSRLAAKKDPVIALRTE
jgi:putative ABC transport system permease protein